MDGLPPDEDGVGEMRGYLKDHVGVFEPDEVVILLAAFDKSWGAVQASGVRYPADKLEFVRAILAKHIIAAAINAVSKFSRYFGRSPDRLGLEDVHAFQVHLVATGISWPALNQIVCALRFFYGVTLGQAIVPERNAYAREPSKLPVVLSADEVVRFLEAIPSLKSRTALTTVYAAGLRVSEVVLLKIADIDSQRMVIRVEQGKGGKDRYVMLSPQLLRILRTYWRLARPKRWLFPGRDDERPLVPQRLARCLPFSLRGGGLEQTDDGAHLAAHIRHPSLGERGGRAHHPGPAWPCQPREHGTLHPSRHQNDQQHAEPARSTPLGSRAARLSGCCGSGSGGGGYLPPPWRSVSTGARRSSRGHRATGHGCHHGVPDGSARRPCRAMRRLRCNPHRLQLVPQPSLSQMPGAGAGPMARGSASRTAAGAVLSCRLHAAGAGRRDRVPEQVHCLRDPVPHGGRDTRHHRGRSQAPRRQARYDHGSSHLGPDPAASSARPLRRSRRRALT